MSGAGDFYTTEDVARLIGVGQRRVQQMLDDGVLVRVARGLVDATSLDRYLAAHPHSRTRAWAEHTAWAAIALLSGVHASWLGQTQASRLRATLRTITAPGDFVARARDRAVVRVYSGHPSAVNRMLSDMVTVDSTGLGLGGIVLSGAGTLSAGGPVQNADGYFPADRLDSTVQFLGLQEDPGGIVTVRATGFDIGVVADLAADGVVLAALDAATSVDPRARDVGERALVDVLDRYRR